MQGDPIDLDNESKTIMEVGGTNSQMKAKIPTLLAMLHLWNLGRLQPQNPITFLGKCMHVNLSSELSSPKKKGKTHSPNLVGLVGISNMTFAT